MKNYIESGVFINRMAVVLPLFVYGISILIYEIYFSELFLIKSGLSSHLVPGVYLRELVVPILIIIAFSSRISPFVHAINCFTMFSLVQSSVLSESGEFHIWALALSIIYMLIGIIILFTGTGKFFTSQP